MNSRLLVTGVGIAAVLGAIAGLYFPSPGSLPAADAGAYAVSLRVQPGTEADSGWLTCSWHRECWNPPTPGTALDWSNQAYANQPAYWKSWGYTDAFSSGTIALVILSQRDLTCSRVVAWVRDIFNFDKSNVYYTHVRTWTPGWEFSISGGSNWGKTSFSVGVTWSDELDECKRLNLWDAPHLHQGADTPRWDWNSSHFLTIYTYYPTWDFAHWQYRQDWIWAY